MEAEAILASTNCEGVAQRFSGAVTEAQVVINRPLAELERLASGDEQVLATRALTDRTGLSIASASNSAQLRRVAEDLLFPGYEEQIRYGALSLSGAAPRFYGETSLVLRTELIEHRTSLVDDDSIRIVDEALRVADRGQSTSEVLANAFSGRRAIWNRRTDLAIAKHAGELATRTDWDETDFPALVLGDRAVDSEPDRVIEAHVWGPITTGTISKAIVHQPAHPVDEAMYEKLSHMLGSCGVDFEVEP